MIRPLLLTALVVFSIAVDPAAARAQGRSIQARDGDVVLVPTDATITVARANTGHIKVVAHDQGRTLIVLLDTGVQPDGIVDWFYRFNLTEPYPPEYHFDGAGTYEEYEILGNHRAGRSSGVVLPQGRIYLSSIGSAARATAFPEHIAAFEYKGSGSRSVRATFDDAEREALTGGASTGVQSSVELRVGGAPAGGVSVTPAPPDGPVRVGGNVPLPAKIKDVAPVMPPAARQAGVIGIVIVEITIDVQGRVSNARILRSIPLLDQAALDAVTQWQFSPTYVNGQARPAIMTVTVPFMAQD